MLSRIFLSVGLSDCRIWFWWVVLIIRYFPYEAFATFFSYEALASPFLKDLSFLLLGDGEGLVDEGWDSGIRVKS